MAGVSCLLCLLCAAGPHLSSSSAVPRSARLVLPGQNVSLSCNLTSSKEITWYVMRSEQLRPLLTVRQTKMKGGATVTFHAANSSHVSWTGHLERGLVTLEIQEVEEEDSGLYFCTGRCTGGVCVNRGVHLEVRGGDGQPASDWGRPPCWSVGVCAVPAFLTLCLVCMVGVYLCSGQTYMGGFRSQQAPWAPSSAGCRNYNTPTAHRPHPLNSQRKTRRLRACDGRVL